MNQSRHNFLKKLVRGKDESETDGVCIRWNTVTSGNLTRVTEYLEEAGAQRAFIDAVNSEVLRTLRGREDFTDYAYVTLYWSIGQKLTFIISNKPYEAVGGKLTHFKHIDHLKEMEHDKHNPPTVAEIVCKSLDERELLMHWLRKQGYGGIDPVGTNTLRVFVKHKKTYKFVAPGPNEPHDLLIERPLCNLEETKRILDRLQPEAPALPSWYTHETTYEPEENRFRVGPQDTIHVNDVNSAYRFLRSYTNFSMVKHSGRKVYDLSEGDLRQMLDYVEWYARQF